MTTSSFNPYLKLSKFSTESLKMIHQAFGKPSPRCQQVFECYAHFKIGQISAQVDMHLKWSITSQTPENVDNIIELTHVELRRINYTIFRRISFIFGIFCEYFCINCMHVCECAYIWMLYYIIRIELGFYNVNTCTYEICF